MHDWAGGGFVATEVSTWSVWEGDGTAAAEGSMWPAPGSANPAATEDSTLLADTVDQGPAMDGYLLCCDVGDRFSFVALRAIRDEIVTRVTTAREEAGREEEEANSRSEADRKAEAERRGWSREVREMWEGIRKRKLR